ncbi:hypothetical protein [Burkholderia vietnamiensis]|uniref:hypothetical protein n=1 Tax=Burkholderia vietnamiensis TaxID=60552 RepID=UPI001BA29A5E|nr:hypothetical protein [Burkholderia vietnamiensis]MBR8206849.1 hypothetical protein [Burkholderia vietnamiensis]
MADGTMGNSPSKASTSIWCFDAFSCLSSRLYRELTNEMVSRINAVIESVSLFDRVVVSQKYYESNKKFFDSLQCDENFVEVVASDQLVHAELLQQGEISFDLAIFSKSIEEIGKEGLFWFFEHSSFARALGDGDGEFAKRIIKHFPLVQLWQWSSANEIADRANATLILPNSLQRMVKYHAEQLRRDNFLSKIRELEKHLSAEIRSIEFLAGNESELYDFKIPSLFAMFCEMHAHDGDAVETLRALRKEMEGIRRMRAKLEGDIRSAKSFRDRSELAKDWQSDWDRLVGMEFKKPSLLKARIANSEVAKTVVDTSAAKLSGLIPLVTALLDHIEKIKTFRRFQAFTRMYDSAGNIFLDDRIKIALKEKFGVQGFLPCPELYGVDGSALSE